MKLIGGLIQTAFWLVWIVLILATPLLGAWLASSLVSFFGGPREAALVGCVLLFPILPLAWEARATRQFKQKVASRNWYGKPPRRWLSAPWRIVLRTLFLNLLFIAALLVWHPKVAFAALATRGDWFLEGRSDPVSQRLRGDLFHAASGLEWLHRWANPNPYKKEGDTAPVPEDVQPTQQVRPPAPPQPPSPPEPLPRPDAGSSEAEPNGPDAGTTTPPEPTPAPEPTPSPDIAQDGDGEDESPDQVWKVGATTWPRINLVSATVGRMRPEDETSIESVGRFIAAHESDPFERVKALHDWVVTRLRYDKESADDDARRRPQDALSVFKARTGVCEGYARLLVALGKVTGDRIVYVVGDVREDNGELASVGHAWNTVQIQGAWYILDATWDDPTSKDAQDNYQTDYLFTPPDIAALDHFPDDARWQLLAKPLSRGDFLRQPLARPGLARVGMALLSPDRSKVEVADALDLRLSNPRRLHVMAELVPEHEEHGVECGIDDSAEARFRCPVPGAGRYDARIYVNPNRYGTFRSVAAIQVTRR
ncbi:MAG: transglutaminase domain-containing protein [Myxococcales bacterium]